MKKLLIAMLFISFTSVSAYAGPQGRGMATGAAIGAGAGALIGLQSNRSVEWALIGGVFGAVAGAILADRNQQPVAYGAQPRPRPHAYQHPRRHRHHKHWRYIGYGYVQNGRRAGHEHEAHERHEAREHRRSWNNAPWQRRFERRSANAYEHDS